MLNVGLTTFEQDLYNQCQAISVEYAIPFFQNSAKDLPPYLLVLDQEKLTLIKAGKKNLKPLYVDFCEGSVAFRRETFSVKNDLLAKAIGVKKYANPIILDTTAGLGRDGFLLACLGCKVTMLERNPILYLLLQDGLRRFANKFAEIYVGLDYELLYQDAKVFLLTKMKYDIIYLDPMFPQRTKSALVKKEMQFLHDIVGPADDSETEELLTLSLKAARYRVVVKRPLHAEKIANLNPSFCYKGKAIRYDVFQNF